jgi:hypothetical protein
MVEQTLAKKIACAGVNLDKCHRFLQEPGCVQNAARKNANDQGDLFDVWQL